jgi:glycosyltransferase involved in cell wall biosynthesis
MRIVVYRSDLLSYSETFIKQQVSFLTNWKPILMGTRSVPGLGLEDLEVVFLNRKRQSPIHAAWREVSKLLWRPLSSDIDIVGSYSPRLIHAHFGTDGVTVYPIAKKLGIPLVVTLHGFDIYILREWWKSGRLGWLNRLYPGRLLQMGQEGVSFIAVSHAVRRRAIEFGLPPERVAVRYIGIDTHTFSAGEVPVALRPKRILFVGRLVEKKGCEFLIRAYRQVLEALPNAELVIVGDGPLRSCLEALAGELNVPATFLGQLDSDAVKTQMGTARVFCLPSIRASNGDAEGLPIVLLEAQACGVPVVTSAMGGATEGILNGVTGFCFPERDVGILAQRLQELLGDDGMAAAMSVAATRFAAERFDIRDCTTLLETYYDELIAASR